MNEEPEIRIEQEAASSQPSRIHAHITIADHNARSRTIDGWFIGWRGPEAEENLKTEGIFALGPHNFVPAPGSVKVRFVDSYGNGKEVVGRISDLGGWTNARIIFDSPVDVQKAEEFVSRKPAAKPLMPSPDFPDSLGRHRFSVASISPAEFWSENDAAGFLVREWARRHAPTARIEEISTLASVVIGDPQSAIRWLSEPNLATDNRPPIDLIGENDGYEHVKKLLLRAEFGALA